MNPDTRRDRRRRCVRRAADPGVLGVAGTSGAHLRRGRADRRPADRSSTAPRRSNRSVPTPGWNPPTASPRPPSWPPASCSAPAGCSGAVVAVGTTTGTGWINEAEADALEYMYNGNTAIVSMQYSFLPSWLSFLVDKENARQAGQALFEAVDALVRHTARGTAPQARRIRRKPGLIRRRGAVHEPQQRPGPHRRCAVFRADLPEHHLERPHRDPRSRLTGMAADLRPRTATCVSWPVRTTWTARTTRGNTRGWSICSTHPIPSRGGIPTCCSANPTGYAKNAATTCFPRPNGSRW